VGEEDKIMCPLETFGGACNDCPYSIGKLLCRKGLLEIHSFYMFREDPKSPYDKRVVELRNRIRVELKKEAGK
jgi:hypothetical protein